MSEKPRRQDLITSKTKAFASSLRDGALDVTFENGKVMYLAAENDEVRDKWVSFLNETAKRSLPGSVLKAASKSGIRSENHTMTDDEDESSEDVGFSVSDGCYLTYAEDSDGALRSNWSQQQVEDFFVYLQPTKKVAKFKYTLRGGVEEVKRKVSGPKNKGFYEGVATFIKQVGLAHSCILYLDTKNSPKPFNVYFVHNQTKLLRLKEEEPVDLSLFDAVGCLPANNTSLKGVRKMEVTRFVQHCNTIGCGIKF